MPLFLPYFYFNSEVIRPPNSHHFSASLLDILTGAHMYSSLHQGVADYFATPLVIVHLKYVDSYIKV
jgi:hypothetical protein